MKPVDTDPETLRGDVRDLTRHAGWPHLCALFERKLHEVEQRILDRKTAPADREGLVLAREKLQEMEPECLAEELINSANNEIKREQNELKKGGK